MRQQPANPAALNFDISGQICYRDYQQTALGQNPIALKQQQTS
jgi:hypothetical protein